MGIEPERGEEGPIIVPSRAAVVASKSGIPEELSEGVSGTA
jgi:hypothetical protein